MTNRLLTFIFISLLYSSLQCFGQTIKSEAESFKNNISDIENTFKKEKKPEDSYFLNEYDLEYIKYTYKGVNFHETTKKDALIFPLNNGDVNKEFQIFFNRKRTFTGEDKHGLYPCFYFSINDNGKNKINNANELMTYFKKGIDSLSSYRAETLLYLGSDNSRIPLVYFPASKYKKKLALMISINEVIKDQKVNSYQTVAGDPILVDIKEVYIGGQTYSSLQNQTVIVKISIPKLRLMRYYGGGDVYEKEFMELENIEALFAITLKL